MSGDDRRPPDERPGVEGNLPGTRPHRRSDERPDPSSVARRDQALPRVGGDEDEARPRAVRTGAPGLREAQERARAERSRPDDGVPALERSERAGMTGMTGVTGVTGVTDRRSDDPLTGAVKAAAGLVRAIVRRLPRL